MVLGSPTVESILLGRLDYVINMLIHLRKNLARKPPDRVVPQIIDTPKVKGILSHEFVLSAS